MWPPHSLVGIGLTELPNYGGGGGCQKTPRTPPLATLLKSECASRARFMKVLQKENLVAVRRGVCPTRLWLRFGHHAVAKFTAKSFFATSGQYG